MAFVCLLLQKMFGGKKKSILFLSPKALSSLCQCGRFANFNSGTASLQLIICVPTNKHRSQTKGTTTSKLLHTFQELSVTLKLEFVDR